MGEPIFELVRGEGPVLAAAIHCGHGVRAEVRDLLALSDDDRLREEDPFTDEWTRVAPTRITALRSRFEVDLNRPRPRAVYRGPEDAWGLDVWNGPLPDEVVERSLAGYDEFYLAVRELYEDLEREYGRFVVLDLHSYNHRRAGPDRPPADEAGNPQVNVGTGTMDRSRWADLVDRFLGDLRAHPFPGGRLDVRENVKFRGAQFGRWAHEEFPAAACVLSIELKKFFMDEWTGVVDRTLHRAIGDALDATVSGLLEELARL